MDSFFRISDLGAIETSIRDGLHELRLADGAAQPGREEVLGAHGPGLDRAEILPLPQVRRPLPFGLRAGFGGQDGHALGGKLFTRTLPVPTATGRRSAS